MLLPHVGCMTIILLVLEVGILIVMILIDQVTIYGSEGRIEFSVFHDNDIVLESKTTSENLFIENPKHIQMHHVEGMRDMLIHKNYTHPSTGLTAIHANWVLDKILGNL